MLSSQRLRNVLALLMASVALALRGRVGAGDAPDDRAGLGPGGAGASELAARYRPVITRAAIKSFLPEMRDFGTRAWHGEAALDSIDSTHGQAYLAYAALALGVARLIDPAFPTENARRHDALITTYERCLLASPTGLIETYPRDSYPTDVAAVAAAIALHDRATGRSHVAVLRHWATRLRAVQIDRAAW